MSASDHAVRLELIIRVHGLKEAEQCFTHIPNTGSQKASCLSLLHGYAKEKDTSKAEALMKTLSGLGLTLFPDPFNEMMKLCAATCQYQKEPLVIEQMKQNKIPRNVLSYNLWMGACAEVSGVTSAERVYKQMLSDNNAMKKRFSVLTHYDWKPSPNILMAIAEYFEKNGNFEDANLIVCQISP